MAKNKHRKPSTRTDLIGEMDQEAGKSKSTVRSDEDEEVEMNDEDPTTPKGTSTQGTVKKTIPIPKKTPSRRRTPSPGDDGDDDDEDDESSSESSSESESETNSDDEDGYENMGQVWTLFLTLCNVDADTEKALATLGYTDATRLQALAYSGTVDVSALLDAGFDHFTAMNVGTFAQFLFLKGDLHKCKTLTSMAKFNLQQRNPKSNRSSDDSEDDAAGLLRLSDGKLTKFSNNDEDFEDWLKEAEITLRQTAFGRCLDQAPSGKDKKAKSTNMSLHYILASAFNGTDAEHVVTEAGKAHKESGHHTSKAILNYYRSSDRRAEVQRRLRDRIDALKLDGSDISAAGIKAYTNQYKMLVEKLSTAKEKWPDPKVKSFYLKNINLADGHPLMVAKLMCSMDTKLKFKETVDKLILADSADANESEESNRARSRRAPENTGGITGKLVPEIPDHVLKAARAARNAQGAVALILKWKRIKNDENRDVRPEELLPNKPNPKQGSNSSHKKGGNDNKKGGNDHKKNRRRRLSIAHDRPSKARRLTKTRQVSAGLKEPTVQVSIKDPTESKPDWTDSDSDSSRGDAEETKDNNDNTTSSHTTTAVSSKKRRRSRSRKRRFKVRRTGRKRRQARSANPNTRSIWDGGTDIEVLGDGWHIDHHWNGHSLSIDGPLEGMDSRKELPLVAGITAHDTKDGPILIGVGVGAYDDSESQVEPLLNPNAISRFCDIDERPTHRNGRQSLVTDCGVVEIQIENGRLPYTITRMPTQRELQMLPINWIVPKCKKVLAETLIRARRSGIIGTQATDSSM